MLFTALVCYFVDYDAEFESLASSVGLQVLFAGHLANYQSRGTFAASEQMSIYGDGVYRDYLDGHGGGPSVDAEYCVPSSMLAAYVRVFLVLYDGVVCTQLITVLSLNYC